MKKIDLGQTVQILANLGVIAGIVFLGIELQQNNALLGAQARTSRTQLRVDGLQSAMNNPELLQVRMKRREGQSLTPIEQAILDMDVTRQLVAWQFVHGEFRAGLIDEIDIPVEQWRYIVAQRPELQEALENPLRFGLRQEFIEWMNENVVE